MKIKDVLEVTGGNTKVIIYTVRNNLYQKLWQGIVDDIHFPDVPYGVQKVSHMSVVNGEDILSIVFDYPESSELDRKIVKQFATGYDVVPIEWVEHLCLKYENPETVRKIICKGREKIYEEIKILE